jgi:hypothetical protein
VWKPFTFKLRYLPGDNCDVHALCKEIVGRGLVVLYGDSYAVIPAFSAHQHINPRESESTLPDPTQSQPVPTRKARMPNPPQRVNDASPRVDDAQVGRERKGKEGKGKEGNVKNTSACAPPDGVVESVWADFQDLRKAKKAPVTQTAIEGIRREAEKAKMSLSDALAMCCERGWTGFKAEWLDDKKPATAPPLQPLSFAQRDELAKRQRWEQMTGRKWPQDSDAFAGETIDSQAVEVLQ